MRIALGLEYDGAAFCGWQSQPGGCGVQDALERALAVIAGAPIRVVAAGRTDAGVHATSQVVHFDTVAARPGTAWTRGVSALLPAAVSVRWSLEAPPAFHARFSATGRHYTYLLLNRAVRPGIFGGHVGWYHRPLALLPMRKAAEALLGRHDFSAFRAAECQASTPVKTLDRLDLSLEDDLLRIELHADAFLQHMVRNIVGALIQVGNGTRDAAWLAAVLDGCDRRRAGATAPASGLYLTGVDYAAQWNLPSTVHAARLPIDRGGACARA